LLLSCHGVPALSEPTVIGGSLGWRSKHHTEAGPAVLGACVFRGTQLGTLICESPFLHDGTTWLLSSTVVITGTWKNGKVISIAYHLLESSIGAYIEWLVKELIMTTNKS
jgi:hypothetical protein